MGIGILCFVLLSLLILRDWLRSRPEEVDESLLTNYDYNGDEVTVEDMILHDMNNDDDTYDIGAIDFNE